MMKRYLMFIFMMILSIMTLSACAPKVGSEAWCNKMEEKDKGDWTANEAGEYAKNCVFK